MILTKQDCYKLLLELNKQGINIEQEIKELTKSNQVPEDIIHFINKNRALDVTNFYNKLRKDNNKGKSKIYINIMKDLEDINEILITLSSLMTHIFIYGKELDGSKRNLFYSSIRLLAIQSAISKYVVEGDGEMCLHLLKQLKADIKILEEDSRVHKEV